MSGKKGENDGTRFGGRNRIPAVYGEGKSIEVVGWRWGGTVDRDKGIAVERLSRKMQERERELERDGGRQSTMGKFSCGLKYAYVEGIRELYRLPHFALEVFSCSTALSLLLTFPVHPRWEHFLSYSSDKHAVDEWLPRGPCAVSSRARSCIHEGFEVTFCFCIIYSLGIVLFESRVTGPHGEFRAHLLLAPPGF